MRRTTPRNWFDVGLAVLAADGPDSLTIDTLCTRLDVTKGSFYHHFDGSADFEARLLKYFEEEGTHQIIETVEHEATPEAKLHRLLDIVVEHSRRDERDPEIAIRAWARQDDAVRAVQERVDERRVAYVQSLCRALGVDDEQALRMAHLLYAALVGCEQMYPAIHGDDLRALFNEYLHLYGLDPSQTPTSRTTEECDD